MRRHPTSPPCEIPNLPPLETVQNNNWPLFHYALRERWVTLHSGDIGDTSSQRERKCLCHGRSVKSWKDEATRPAAENFLQQQARFDDFTDYYNRQRPHQALEMKVPADLILDRSDPIRDSARSATPFQYRTVTVSQCGRVCYNGQKINLSRSFAGQNVGVKQVDDQVWLISFMQYDLGYFDSDTCRLEPIENPFAEEVLPMCPEWTLTIAMEENASPARGEMGLTSVSCSVPLAFTTRYCLRALRKLA